MMTAIVAGFDADIAPQKIERRRWSDAEKRRLVALTFEPGASVAKIARRHDLNANLLFNWRRGKLALNGTAVATKSPVMNFATVDVAAGAPPARADKCGGSIAIELRSGVVLRVDGGVSEQALRSVLSALKVVG
jgi:transposase